MVHSIGVYDLIGNVAEWVSDYYNPNYYCWGPDAVETTSLYCASNSTPHSEVLNNPQGPNSGSTRVIKGGGWWPDYDNGSSILTQNIGNRLGKEPGLQWSIGIRCGMDAQ